MSILAQCISYFSLHNMEEDVKFLTKASTVVTAILFDATLLESLAKLLRLRPKVIRRVLLVRQNITRRDQEAIHIDALSAIRKMQRMIQRSLCLVVGIPIQVPVRVAAKHDGRLLGRRQRHHLEIPLVLLHRVRDVRHDLAGKPFLSVRVDYAKGDARRGVRRHGEVAPVPAVRPSVQGIRSIGRGLCGILIRRRVICLAVNSKGAVLDAVRVPARHAAKVRMLLVNAVVGGIVEAAHEIALDAVAVIDEQV